VAASRQVEVDGRELKLTNLDKVLYPEAGFTKGEVVDYYAKVAPAMVPHLAGRALTLRRFPEGVDDTEAAFFEKRCPKHRPEWVKTTRVLAGPRSGYIDYCVCEDLPTLVWMAQLAAIELHPSLSLGDDHDRPTVLAFDLDPGPPADILDCCRVGLRLRLRPVPRASIPPRVNVLVHKYGGTSMNGPERIRAVAQRIGAAPAPHRTFRTARGARCAHRRTQFHHGLVPVARGGRG